MNMNASRNGSPLFVGEGVMNSNMNLTIELEDKVLVIEEKGANSINLRGYACLEYANSRFQTKTCIDGGNNPSFN